MANPPSFTLSLGQVFQGECLQFEVINLEPLTVRCLENSGWWSRYNRGYDEKEHATWKVGEEYELYYGFKAYNFHTKHGHLPWCSLYEDGSVQHYR